ncbi:hypothetical protein KAU15_02790, partial [candidate division WOR-3 bacterium]|nr:hypothetical protein [candidate division WOR-3 bacterium]
EYIDYIACPSPQKIFFLGCHSCEGRNLSLLISFSSITQSIREYLVTIMLVSKRKDGYLLSQV